MGQALAGRMLVAMRAKRTVNVTLGIDKARPGNGDIELSNPVKVAYEPGSGGIYNVVAVGGVTYMKGDPFASARPWFKFDPKGTDVSKEMSGPNDLSRSLDPRPVVSMMKGIKGQDLGTDKAGGVLATHYAFEIPFAAASKMLSPATLNKGQEMLEQGTLKMPLTVDYWSVTTTLFARS